MGTKEDEIIAAALREFCDKVNDRIKKLPNGVSSKRIYGNGIVFYKPISIFDKPDSIKPRVTLYAYVRIAYPFYEITTKDIQTELNIQSLLPTINQIIKSENYSLVPLDCFNMVELASPSHNIKPRVCKWCGKEIEQTTRGKPKQFCDSKCKHQEENFFGLSIEEKHKKMYYHLENVNLMALYNQLTPYTNEYQERDYNDEKNREIFYSLFFYHYMFIVPHQELKEMILSSRICPYCKTTFKADTAQQRYCSKECYEKANEERKRERRKNSR